MKFHHGKRAREAEVVRSSTARYPIVAASSVATTWAGPSTPATADGSAADERSSAEAGT